MAYAIALDTTQWGLVRDLFETDRGRPPVIPRRQMVDAMLFLARTGCQWRYLPARYGPWGAVWQQWLRWRNSGVWAIAMDRLARQIRVQHGRKPTPSMVMIDAQTVKGGRAGPTFHEAGGRGGRTVGAKRTVLIEIMGLPVAAEVESARPHDVSAGRRVLREALPALGTVTDVLADRGYRGLTKAAGKHGARVVIKAPAPGQSGFQPIAPLYKVEHAFAQLGRWRRLSRCFEQTRASAQAWLQVAAFGYLLGRV
jgi:putative transposase